ASVRAFAGILPSRQSWLLVDHDAANLAAAATQLAKWDAPAALEIQTLAHDFTLRPDCWPQGTEVVTASALLDLTSQEWIGGVVEALAWGRLPLLATLTVNGLISVAPAHALDEAVFEAFRVHQETDKGFGPALGGFAAPHLEAALSRAGYRLEAGDSPWIID